jgi:hypothetical protein
VALAGVSYGTRGAEVRKSDEDRAGPVPPDFKESPDVMKPTQAARTLRKVGPKFSTYLVQQKVSRLLDGRRLSKLDDLGQALVRRMLGDPITVEVDGLKIQGPFDSRWMLYHMKAEIYEPLEVELFKQTVGPEMTVLDVGANIGFYSLLASRAVGNGGAVHAFEADPRNAIHLEANARSNGCSTSACATWRWLMRPGPTSFAWRRSPPIAACLRR